MLHSSSISINEIQPVNYFLAHVSASS